MPTKLCKYCKLPKQHIYLKTDSKGKTYHTDETGSWWKAAKCPDCCSVARPKACKVCNTNIDVTLYPNKLLCGPECVKEAKRASKARFVLEAKVKASGA